MESRWSKKEVESGCTNCSRKPDQVAVVSTGGIIVQFCLDCLNELHDTTLTLIDDYDGYDDD